LICDALSINIGLMIDFVSEQKYKSFRRFQNKKPFNLKYSDRACNFLREGK
jgi:hypothetical protein